MICKKMCLILSALFNVAVVHAKPFTIMTLNTYAWPEKINEITRAFDKELASGITKPIGQRIDEIANFVQQKKADIVVFQELWGINNKKRMIKDFGCSMNFPKKKFFGQEIEIVPDKVDCTSSFYRYNVFDNSLNPIDSGLMIASRFPILRHHKIVFPEKLDEEKLANKGALFALIKTDDANRPYVLVVNSHLQSGTPIEYIQVRERQMQQIAKEIKALHGEKGKPGYDSRLDDAHIVIIGDFNDPIKYLNYKKRLSDRTGFMINALRKEGINVSNEQERNILIKDLGAEEILDVNELKREGVVYSTANGKKLRTLEKTDPLVQGLGRAGYEEGSYFKFATDNPGGQLLDHIFLDDKSKILNYAVLRKEVLADPGTEGISSNNAWDSTTGKNKSYNPDIALSDHAAIMATIE